MNGHNRKIVLYFTISCKKGKHMSQITKRAMETSLKKLLRTKSLNKITITDITEDCGINRMTFYYHFKDIYDLVEWSWEEDTKKLLAGRKTYETWTDGFLKIFEFLKGNKLFVLNICQSIRRDYVENYLYQFTYRLLIDVIEEKSTNIQLSQADKHFIANFYKYAFVGLLLEWINENMETAPEEIIKKTAAIMHGNIVRALENFRTDINTSKSE